MIQFNTKQYDVWKFLLSNVDFHKQFSRWEEYQDLL